VIKVILLLSLLKIHVRIRRNQEKIILVGPFILPRVSISKGTFCTCSECGENWKSVVCGRLLQKHLMLLRINMSDTHETDFRSINFRGVSGFDCIWFSNMPKQENTILQIFHALVNSSCVPSPPPLCERWEFIENKLGNGLLLGQTKDLF